MEYEKQKQIILVCKVVSISVELVASLSKHPFYLSVFESINRVKTVHVHSLQ